MRKTVIALGLLVFLGVQLSAMYHIPIVKANGATDLRQYWAEMMWANITAKQVNATFPLNYIGSSSNGTVCNNELLTGILFYLQTGNTSFLTKTYEFANWVNDTDIRNLMFSYEKSTESWYNGANHYAIGLLAALANYNETYKPLLQTACNYYISTLMNASSNRVYQTVSYAGAVIDSTCAVSTQAVAIQFLGYAAHVLANTTIRDIAKNMILNFTRGTANLPPYSLTQNGVISSATCKEDEGFAWYILALSSFYNLFTDADVYDLINSTAMSFHDHQWNASGAVWAYTTDCNTGAITSDLAVHGFGYTDEAMVHAYLITGNETFLTRAKTDLWNMVYNSTIVKYGLIAHSTAPTQYDADETWNTGARRAANIFYNLDYAGFYRNDTWLTMANDLFINTTVAHNRSVGWQYKVDTRDYSDWPGALNSAVWTPFWLQYVNQTEATMSAIADLYYYFGMSKLGNMEYAPDTYESPPPAGDIAWYMRSDTHTVNTVLGFQLNETNTATASNVSLSDVGAKAAYFGFRVYTVNSKGVSTELSGGVVGVSYRVAVGAGVHNSVWLCPRKSMSLGFDAIKAELYLRVGDAGTWTLKATFITDRLMQNTLVNTTWMFSLYTNRTYGGGATTATAWFGDSTHASCVRNVDFDAPNSFETTLYYYKTGDFIRGILHPYMAPLGGLFWALPTLMVFATLYIRYRSFKVVLVVGVLFGGTSGLLLTVTPAPFSLLVGFILTVSIGVWLFKVIR